MCQERGTTAALQLIIDPCRGVVDVEVDVGAVDTTAEAMYDFGGACRVFGRVVNGVEDGPACGGRQVGSVDGTADLQRERAVAGTGFEYLDGRCGGGGWRGDVDVEEGDDSGCVEGVDLLLPNGVSVSATALEGSYVRELPVCGSW